MNDPTVIEISRDTVATMLLLMTPPMVVALGVGLSVAILQAATQVQEMTLAFVPKIVAVFLAVALFGPWMASTMIAFTQRVLTGFPNLVR